MFIPREHGGLNGKIFSSNVCIVISGNSHRSWPVPTRPWVMRMRWRELLFAHWQVDEKFIRPLLPAGLALDLFDGRCYIGAVPFLMEDTSPRFIPPIPGLHKFPELNLRTYVTANGKPGVWFFSLDAGSKLAVRCARRFFHLPYFDAKFDIDVSDRVRYRAHRGAPAAQFDAIYRPVGPVYESAPGSLDAWLTDRYCLYSADRLGRLYRCEIDHGAWPLQRAEADIRANSLGDSLRIPMHGDLTLHFAKSLDVRAWLIEKVNA